MISVFVPLYQGVKNNVPSDETLDRGRQKDGQAE